MPSGYRHPGARSCLPIRPDAVGGSQPVRPSASSGRRPAVAQECDFLAPLRPADAFCAFVPPWLELDLLLPPPEALPPLLDESGTLAIRAARDLLMPFLRR